MFKPATVTERHVNTEPLPASPEAEPVVEAQTHTHSENGYHVSDTEETDRVSGPSAAEVVGLGAAALGAAGLGIRHGRGRTSAGRSGKRASASSRLPSLLSPRSGRLLPSRRRSTSRQPKT